MGRPKKQPAGVSAAAPVNANELVAEGWSETPELWHTGAGSGHVFEKIVNGVRQYVKVDAEGNVVSED